MKNLYNYIDFVLRNVYFPELPSANISLNHIKIRCSFVDMIDALDYSATFFFTPLKWIIIIAIRVNPIMKCWNELLLYLSTLLSFNNVGNIIYSS
jgi:hypothetical protein